MNRLLEFIRILWIKARLRIPACVEQTVVPRLHETKEILRLLFRPYLPVYRLQGQGQGGPLTVTYIGLDYAKPFLIDLIFSEEPQEHKVGQVPFWRHKKLVEWPSSDIVIVEATKHLICKLPRQNAFVLPQYVHHTLDVSGDWQDVKGRLRKSVRHELRLTRKYGYGYEVSHDKQDFEVFYYEMYLPTMKHRHGELASPMSFSEANSYLQQGLLFLVKRDNQPICGSICQIKQDTVRYMIMGVMHGEQKWMEEGAVGALNCLRLQWANEQGYKAVNFLGSGIPRLNGGMFQHKRKWGTAISVPPHLHRQIWIAIQQNTIAVAHFLMDNPFITVDEKGKLHGLIIVENVNDVSDEDKERWEKCYAIPGLSSFNVRSVKGLARETTSRSDMGLVIPIPLSSGSGS